MKIEYLGHSCFVYTFAKGKKIITDPYTKVGYELPKNVTADIITISHGHFDHNYASAIGGNPIIVNNSNGYEDNDIKIMGIDSFHDDKKGALRGKNVIYKIFADGLTICHFGDLGEPCSNELCEKIGQVDILCIPIGGTYTIDSVDAKMYIEKLMPKTVIPMHYKGKDCALDVADEKEFLSFYEQEDIEYCKGEHILPPFNKKIIFMERKEGI